MTIFEIQIWGETAEYFCSLTAENKVQWIKDNTSQKDDVIINEFLQSKYKGTKVCCAKCGEKHLKDGNISETVSNSVATFTTSGNTTEYGGSHSNERRATNKRRKAK